MASATARPRRIPLAKSRTSAEQRFYTMNAITRGDDSRMLSPINVLESRHDAEACTRHNAVQAPSYVHDEVKVLRVATPGCGLAHLLDRALSLQPHRVSFPLHGPVLVGEPQADRSPGN